MQLYRIVSHQIMSEEKIINQKEKCLSQKTRATTDEIKH